MNYQQLTESSPKVLVEFFASWCPHCQRMMPIVADLKKRLEGKVKVYQFDIDENPELSDSQKVETIPTFIVYTNGEETFRQSGEMTEEALIEAIDL